MHSFRPLPLSFACALAVGAAMAGPAHAQNLQQVYDLARAYDSSFQSVQAQYDAAVSRAEQARAGLLPSAGLTAGVSRANNENTNPAVTRNVTTQNMGISASQPLYRPANRITFEQGQRGIAIAQSQLDAAAQDLTVRVSQAYFDTLAAQDTLTVVRAQKSAVAEQLASAKRNFEVGTSTITDAREAQARYDLVTAQEIAAENDLQVKQLTLDQLVGQSGIQPRPLALPVTLPEVLPTNVNAWVDQSEAHQPQIQQAMLALDVARLETRKAETGHLPTVDLTASYGKARYPDGTATALSPTRTNSASVGVALNLPLFAGFATQNRIRETLSLEQKAEADLQTVRRNVAQAVRASYFGIVSATGQTKALEAAEASSQSALDANRLGYQVGVRINIDVLNAQSQLFQTKRDLALARYNVLVGNLKLRQAAGVLTPQDLQTVNALLVP